MTKEDANEEAGSFLVPARNVRGRVVLSIPDVGYASYLLSSSWGLVLFFLLTGSLLLANEGPTLPPAGIMGIIIGGFVVLAAVAGKVVVRRLGDPG